MSSHDATGGSAGAASDGAGGARRLEAVFSGRVQGVFFRATTEQIARELAVAGWVRNEPDGTVRLVAEGERAELERLLAGIREARGRNIEDVACTWSEARGDLEGFRIRR